ncbi:MAG: TIGR03790 family protein [Phycisphaerae bacterium]|nr:TIGR03790 family protein [Phycisphaerae bacterium]
MNYRLSAKSVVAALILLFITDSAFALEPNEILVIANGDIPESVRLADYYCFRRNVPPENVLKLPLGKILANDISRTNYDKKIAEPIRKKLSENSKTKIKCLLTMWGVPYRVGPRGMLKDEKEKLSQLKAQLESEKRKLILLETTRSYTSDGKKQIEKKIKNIESQINWIEGKETGASVDSELSLVRFGDYELYRWQPNRLSDPFAVDNSTLMVSRLDAPTAQIVVGLIDKALRAERDGLNGFAYIDSRGIAEDGNPYSFGHYDESMRQLAGLVTLRTKLTVVEEKTTTLFSEGKCPQTAIYCGWYSLKKYIDSFEFIDGAIGYHIASFEAVHLHDPNSTEWCPSMLQKGVTATIGSVAEPYLHAFPEPRRFFLALFNGWTLAEAFYQTKPFNSWQMLLIGDPLYRPFDPYVAR